MAVSEPRGTMVEVELRPGVPGCVTLPLALMSLGTIPLLMRWNERRFVRRMDEQGVETRGGKQIAWQEFTRIERAQSSMRAGRTALQTRTSNDLYGPAGHGLSDEFLLASPKGRVSVPLWRARNRDAVRAFTLEHLPAHLLPPRR
jgi:hypothetical protein